MLSESTLLSDFNSESMKKTNQLFASTTMPRSKHIPVMKIPNESIFMLSKLIKSNDLNSESMNIQTRTLHVMIHRSCKNFPFLTTKNRFDGDLTGKMTELDQTKHIFRIPTKNAYNRWVIIHDPMNLRFQPLTLFILNGQSKTATWHHGQSRTSFIWEYRKP